MKSEGLNYTEGAKRYGLSVSDIYEYNKRFKKSTFERSPGKVRNWTKMGEYVSNIEKLGMSYVEGAAHFGISVSSIYKYNSQIKGKNEVKSLSQESEESRDRVSALSCEGDSSFDRSAQSHCREGRLLQRTMVSALMMGEWKKSSWKTALAFDEGHAAEEGFNGFVRQDIFVDGGGEDKGGDAYLF